MIGLLYLLFLGLYLLSSAFVIYLSTRYARRRFGKGWAGGWLAAFIMYNLVFWDWVPVYVLHKYYCSTEAGFWVYKSPEQWIKENPETVGERWGEGFVKKSETINEHTSRYWASDRVFMEVTHTRSFNDEIGRSERVLVDNETGEILSRAIEFYRGSPGALALGTHSLSDYKIWLSFGHRICGPASTPGGSDTPNGYMNLFSKHRYTLLQLGRGEIK